MTANMKWLVQFSTRADKGLTRLPMQVRKSLALLLADIEEGGPVRGDWPNYGKLAPGRHHCHLKKGKPTYVAVWEERGAAVRFVEVVYVGTHEKAPY